MTVETATNPTQLNTAWPTSGDFISEGDDHIRVIKTVIKTTFPNLGGAWNATAAEANYVVGVTSSIQRQLDNKGALAGQVWTGTHDFAGAAITVPTAAPGDNSTKAASTAFVAAQAFSGSLPAQTGNAGKFITTNGTVASWSDTINGNLTISGTGSRVGLSPGATPADGTLFQSPVLNNKTSVGITPNGAILAPGATTSEVVVYNSTPATNYSYGEFSLRQNESVRFVSGKAGSGGLLPMFFDMDGITRLSIETVRGSVGVNLQNPTHVFHVDNKFAGGLPSTSNVSPDRNVITRFQNTGVAVDVGADNALTGWIQARSQSNNATNLPLLLNPNGGQVLAGGALGYGTGAGGTVTQATNKATGVTLNKPNGQITMNSSALAAGAAVVFSVSNSYALSTSLIDVCGGYNAGAPDPSNYRIELNWSGDGVFSVRVTNISTGTLSDALVINFQLRTGSTS